jgi:CHAT domain-containing protein/tetratricopeptide (TPR) repeat protein
LVVIPFQLRLARKDTSELGRLVVASDHAKFRATEARLTGDYDYRPLARNAPAPVLPPPGQIRSTHARAVAHLLTGDPDNAVRLLEEELRATPGKASLLADLGAAFYERAVRRQQPEDFAAAFSAVTAALDLDPDLAAAVFTRAVVLESLHLREDAAAEWRRYLEQDSGSAWALEARARLARVERPASLPADSAEALRVAVEDQVLGEWADRVIHKDEQGARAALDRATDIVNRLAAKSADRTAARTLATIREHANPAALADAHHRYAGARRLYLKSRDEAARAAMHDAATHLERVRAPLAMRAWIFTATVSHYLGRSEEGLAILERVDESLRGHERDHPLAAGQMLWTRGLICQGLGRYDDALRDYRAARPYLESTHEPTAVAGIAMVTAESYRNFGDLANAWTENLRAVAALNDGAAYTRRQIVLNDTALLAMRSGHPRLAELVAMRMRRNAEVERDPIYGVQALLTRGRALLSLGSTEAARAAVEEAFAGLSRLQRNGTTRRLFADVITARAESLAETNPAAAISFITDAATELASLNHRARLPRLHLVAGRAHETLRDFAGAERAWQAGLRELESLRLDIGDDHDRSTFTDAGRMLFDNIVRLEVKRGRTTEALGIVRRARTVGLTGRRATAASSPSSGAGATSTVIEYYVLPEMLLMWSTTGARTSFRSVSMAASGLEEIVNRTANAIRDCAVPSDCIEETSAAFDMLVRPAGPLGNDITIAPDGALHRIPFAALYDRQRSRFLAEDHAITTLLSEVPPEPVGPLRSVFVAAARAPADDQRALAFVDLEATVAARSFPSSVVVRGRDATADRFLQEAGGHDVVHFAGHARWNERQPRRAALLLSDRRLFAEELSRQAFARTRLVVLAGCDTARGRLTTAGPLSLARTFAAAGVPHVIGSLWPVDDQESVVFFRSFYETLADGASPASAVAIAQCEVAARSGPATWATFQIYSSSGKKEMP